MKLRKTLGARRSRTNRIRFWVGVPALGAFVLGFVALGRIHRSEALETYRVDNDVIILRVDCERGFVEYGVDAIVPERTEAQAMLNQWPVASARRGALGIEGTRVDSGLCQILKRELEAADFHDLTKVRWNGRNHPYSRTVVREMFGRLKGFQNRSGILIWQ